MPAKHSRHEQHQVNDAYHSCYSSVVTLCHNSCDWIFLSSLFQLHGSPFICVTSASRSRTEQIPVPYMPRASLCHESSPPLSCQKWVLLIAFHHTGTLLPCYYAKRCLLESWPHQVDWHHIMCTMDFCDTKPGSNAASSHLSVMKLSLLCCSASE